MSWLVFSLGPGPLISKKHILFLFLEIQYILSKLGQVSLTAKVPTYYGKDEMCVIRNFGEINRKTFNPVMIWGKNLGPKQGIDNALFRIDKNVKN
jgi:hypothetical protein